MLSNQFKFSDELIEELKTFYQKKYNKIISDYETQKYLNGFADLFNFITKKGLTVEERGLPKKSLGTVNPLNKLYK